MLSVIFIGDESKDSADMTATCNLIKPSREHLPAGRQVRKLFYEISGNIVGLSTRMLDLVFQNFTKDKSFKGDFFKKILLAGVVELGLEDKSIEISLNLVDQSKIRELNREYRNKDKATDVLSFPMQSFRLHRPEGVKRFEGPFDHAQDKSNVTAFDLGDIFICLSFAKNDAKSENVSIDKKLAQLTVHGFLHLLGYDHERSKKEAEKMFGLETKILSKL